MRIKAMASRRALVLGAFAVAAGALQAQPVNNDYYTSQGTELLRTVEQYHLYPGQERFRKKLYEAAFGDYVFILRYFPNHPQALLMITQVCTEWKSPQCDLEPVFEKAVSIRPNAAGTLVAYGIFLHRSKKFPEAIANYRQAIAIEPQSMNAHYNLGLAYAETGQWSLANEHAQRAYALGAPLQGLRDRLTKAGQWKPLPATGAPTGDPGPVSTPGAAPTVPPR